MQKLMSKDDPNARHIHLPTVTIIKCLVTIFLVFLAVKLSSLLMLLFLSVLLAVTLNPLLVFLEKRMRRSLAFVLLTLTLMAVGAVIVLLVIPPIVDQVGNMVRDFPKTREMLLAKLPDQSGIKQWAERFLSGKQLPEPAAAAEHLLTVGQLAVGAFTEVFLIAIFSLYFLVDGPRAFAWGIAFFSLETREKLHKTAKETSRVVFAYVAGQAITSTLAAVFAFTILTILKVPAAMTLALMAGVFDVLPILGFFLSTIPAVLMALTVSPTTPLIVVGAYVAYHAVENYLIVPKVYGDRLKVSTLVVLIGLSAAGIVAGVWGAVAILPVVASYPIIERIWLAESLGRETVKKHRQKEKSE